MITVMVTGEVGRKTARTDRTDGLLDISSRR
jgi:hypothetical protein